MKLLVQTAMIFFGTLLAAGLIALGDPGGPAPVVQPEPARTVPASPLFDPARPERTATARTGP
jgi:hypothetical protein